MKACAGSSWKMGLNYGNRGLVKALAIALLDCHPCDSQGWDRAGLGPFVWAWVLLCQRRGSVPLPYERAVLTTVVNLEASKTQPTGPQLAESTCHQADFCP